jgi:hypothetical protein
MAQSNRFAELAVPEIGRRLHMRIYFAASISVSYRPRYTNLQISGDQAADKINTQDEKHNIFLGNLTGSNIFCS